jgi:gamma-aminobutyric acid type B receptor
MIWLLTVGLCVMLATLLAKTWRVFRVFINESLRRVQITNLYLAAVISGLLVVPLVLVVVWTAIGGLEAEYRVESTDILTENYYECHADTSDVVLASLLISYVGVLVISGAVFAYFIRDVTYLLYNESRYIGYALYTMLVFGILGIALQASGVVSREGLFIIRSCLLMGGTLIMVLVLFLPKIYFMAMGYKKDYSTDVSMLEVRTHASPVSGSANIATTSSSSQ